MMTTMIAMMKFRSIGQPLIDLRQGRQQCFGGH
jgi:hypothetical protein